MKASRIPELDGLRGIAILLVLVAHMGAGTGPANRVLFSWWDGGGGGLVGVQLFFALSGYLITGILLREREKTGTIDFKAFYLRRVRRLYPALVVICGVVGLAALIFRARFRGAAVDLVLALTYTTNLAGLARPLLGIRLRHVWLAHTWSLAVEEQFYIAWPLMLFLAARKGRQWVGGVALALALVTIVARFALPIRPENMYNLMRWDALLLGCALAAHPVHVPRVLGWLGWGVILCYAIEPIREITPLDFTLTSLASVLVLSRALGNRFLCKPHAEVVRDHQLRAIPMARLRAALRPPGLRWRHAIDRNRERVVLRHRAAVPAPRASLAR